MTSILLILLDSVAVNSSFNAVNQDVYHFFRTVCDLLWMHGNEVDMHSLDTVWPHV